MIDLSNVSLRKGNLENASTSKGFTRPSARSVSMTAADRRRFQNASQLVVSRTGPCRIRNLDSSKYFSRDRILLGASVSRTSEV